jgi:hypothetical protein
MLNKWFLFWFFVCFLGAKKAKKAQKGLQKPKRVPGIDSERAGTSRILSCVQVNKGKVFIPVVVLHRAKQIKTRQPKPPE